jgi:hypothetical protein
VFERSKTLSALDHVAIGTGVSKNMSKYSNYLFASFNSVNGMNRSAWEECDTGGRLGVRKVTSCWTQSTVYDYNVVFVYNKTMLVM